MQINHTNNINFNAVRCTDSLMSRLNTPKRNLQFEEFKNSQKDKPYDIIITVLKNDALSVTAVSKENRFGLTDKENVISNFFNLNPVNFLQNFVKKVEKYIG